MASRVASSSLATKEGGSAVGVLVYDDAHDVDEEDDELCKSRQFGSCNRFKH